MIRKTLTVLVAFATFAAIATEAPKPDQAPPVPPATAEAGGKPELWVEDQPYLLHHAQGPMTLDGQDHPEEWAKAMKINGFRVPAALTKAQTLTEAWLLWDDDCLYVKAFAHDEDIRAKYKERTDPLYEEDVVELFLKPYADKVNLYEFEVNALGTVMALEIPKFPKPSIQEMSKWEPGTRVGVQVLGTLNDPRDHDTGYRIVLALPWKNLRFLSAPPKKGDTWSFTLARYDYSAYLSKSPECSASAPLTKLSFAQYQDYTPLKFAE